MAKQLTGMRINEAHLKKLKYMSWHDRRTFTATLEILIEQGIAAWEKTNGSITDQKIINAKIK